MTCDGEMSWWLFFTSRRRRRRRGVLSLICFAAGVVSVLWLALLIDTDGTLRERLSTKDSRVMSALLLAFGVLALLAAVACGGKSVNPPTGAVLLEEPSGGGTGAVLLEEPSGGGTEAVLLEEPSGGSGGAVLLEEPSGGSGGAVLLEEPSGGSGGAVLLEKPPESVPDCLSWEWSYCCDLGGYSLRCPEPDANCECVGTHSKTADLRGKCWASMPLTPWEVDCG
jgi:hypothetical protein